ncbi:hypothetical protein ACIA5D_43360 [Actinoplanes sp. NPDC051513]|uniref:hypothetical protein n=1 Tax=Actinoplanes sp. NPDC051513 TaxID=3363908 RepID=UPI00378BE3DE
MDHPQSVAGKRLQNPVPPSRPSTIYIVGHPTHSATATFPVTEPNIMIADK